MYQDKLAQLKKQLQQLKDGTLPEYMKKLRKIDQSYRERLRINEIWYQYEVSLSCNMNGQYEICNIWSVTFAYHEKPTEV